MQPQPVREHLEGEVRVPHGLTIAVDLQASNNNNNNITVIMVMIMIVIMTKIMTMIMIMIKVVVKHCLSQGGIWCMRRRLATRALQVLTQASGLMRIRLDTEIVYKPAVIIS